MVLGVASAAAAATGGTGVSLFEYNRQNFLYDRKMRQETEYQIMDFRIKQAELWREDVKDIIGLTSVKMDTYLIVNAVQLGFCVMAFCEGRLAAGTPTWLIGCHTLCLGGAFMYLLMSVWLSMHASVTAKAYEVRLLTQHVRLPVPTWAQLEGARTYASGFEKVNGKQMFRVPFVMGTQEAVLKTSRLHESSHAAGAAAPVLSDATDGEATVARATMYPDGVESADLWGLEARGENIYELDGTLRSDPRNLRHLRLVHEAMQYWQSFDGFARVAMSMGTNQLVTALAYYVIAYVLISNHAVIACWLAVFLFMVITSALIQLDMSLTGFEYRISVFLVTTGPAMAAVAAQQWLLHKPSSDELVRIVAPCIYVTHTAWLLFLLHVCKVSEQKNGSMLPVGFRSVMYIDIFGWIKSLRPPARRGRHGGILQPDTLGTQVPGLGPGTQSVAYDRNRPVPTRPELMLGAASQAPDTIKREDFEPSTFIPRMRDESDMVEANEGTADSDHVVIAQKPGNVPWKIFWYATMTLTILWWVSGFFVMLQIFGIDWFKVAPLLRVEHMHELPESEPSLLQTADVRLEGGEAIPTRWPRQHVQPHSLACSDKGGILVSASRFGLFTAPLPLQRDGGIEFQKAGACLGLEGEALRDTSILCAADDSGECSAFVLHRQGQAVSQCKIMAAMARGHAASFAPSARIMSFADSWLYEGDPQRGVPQEEVESIAFVGHCAIGEGKCAFAETSSRRIVEMRATGPQAGGELPGGAPQAVWYPARVVQTTGAKVQGRDNTAQELGAASLVSLESTSALDSSLRFIGEPHMQQLGTIRANTIESDDGDLVQQKLEVIDATSGSVRGVWALPKNHRWTSMCSAGDALYLLAAGTSPQVWRFPLPAALRSAPLANATGPAAATAVAQSVAKSQRLSADRATAARTPLSERAARSSAPKSTSMAAKAPHTLAHGRLVSFGRGR